VFVFSIEIFQSQLSKVKGI